LGNKVAGKGDLLETLNEIVSKILEKKNKASLEQKTKNKKHIQSEAIKQMGDTFETDLESFPNLLEKMTQDLQTWK
jgi:hypothetical protein